MDKIMEQVSQHLDEIGIKYTREGDAIIYTSELNRAGDRMMTVNIDTHHVDHQISYLVYNVILTSQPVWGDKQSASAVELDDPHILAGMTVAINRHNTELVGCACFVVPGKGVVGFRISHLIKGSISKGEVMHLDKLATTVAGELWMTYNKTSLEAYTEGEIEELPGIFIDEFKFAIEEGKKAGIEPVGIFKSFYEGDDSKAAIKALASGMLLQHKLRNLGVKDAEQTAALSAAAGLAAIIKEGCAEADDDDDDRAAETSSDATNIEDSDREIENGAEGY